MPPQNGIDTDALKLAIKAWAMACSGLTDQQVYEAMQNGVKAIKPFITLLLAGPYRDGVIDALQPGAGDNGVVSGPRRYNVNIDIYADPANDVNVEQIGEAMQASFDVPEYRALLTECNVSVDKQVKVGVGIGEIQAPIDLSAQLDTKWERHVHFEFSINVSSNVNLTAQLDTLDPANTAAALNPSLS